MTASLPDERLDELTKRATNATEPMFVLPTGDARRMLAELQSARSRIAALEGALTGFAEAADIFEREYEHLMKPETGCNIRFDALCAARAALSKDSSDG